MACVALAFGDSYAVGWRDTAATAPLQSAFEELRGSQPAAAGRGLSLGRVPDAVPVLLVEFPDRPHSVLVPQDSVHASFFGAGASVRSFYQESSYDRFQLEGTTTPWLRLPQTLDYYANGSGGVGNSYPRNAQRMVEDAVRAADSSVDFSLYDNDGPDGVPSSGDDDGYVDGIMVVHAGTGAEYGNADNILSHSFFTSQPIPTNDGPSVWLYATVAETSPLGTNAHEFGHILGLPDLYQLGGSQRSAGGLGDWSSMGSGSWRGDGLTPTDLDAPSKIELGFVDPIIPTTNSSNLRLRAGRDGVPLFRSIRFGRMARRSRSTSL